MTNRERILRQIAGESVDRIPLLGGWVEGARNVADLAGVSVEEYLADPDAGVMRANRELHVDGMVPPIAPRTLEEIRSGSLKQQDFNQVEPEALLERAEQIPDSEVEVLAAVDAAAVEENYRSFLTGVLAQFGDMVLIPTFWEAIANFSLYFQYGYEAFLSAVALYPEAVGRIFWEDGIRTRRRNEILVKLFHEFDLPPILFCGHDICNGAGPMCSPVFLRQYYWSHAKRSVEPLLEAGIRLVCHCDGNVMPLVDDFIEAGFSGFQGFQYELGVDPRELRDRCRRRQGRDPLFFGGLSITGTLPFGTAADVEDEIAYILDYTEGGRGLFLFTSNVTGAEVPPENIRAGYRAMERFDPSSPRQQGSAPIPWPWGASHG